MKSSEIYAIILIGIVIIIGAFFIYQCIKDYNKQNSIYKTKKLKYEEFQKAYANAKTTEEKWDVLNKYLTTEDKLKLVQDFDRINKELVGYWNKVGDYMKQAMKDINSQISKA